MSQISIPLFGLGPVSLQNMSHAVWQSSSVYSRGARYGNAMATALMKLTTMVVYSILLQGLLLGCGDVERGKAAGFQDYARSSL